MIMAQDPNTPNTETPEERERLLSRYKGADRELIEDAVRDHPGLTVAKAIEMLDAFGGL
jgi:hypothetical protein